MLRYIMKRFLMMIPVILGITFIIFAIMNFTPGDPAKLILGEEATAEDVAKLRTELGLDDPFLVRFARYVINAVQGDFGTSYRNRQPVFNEIFDRFPTTFKVAFFGILIAVFIGVPIGILSAVKQYSINRYHQHDRCYAAYGDAGIFRWNASHFAVRIKTEYIAGYWYLKLEAFCTALFGCSFCNYGNVYSNDKIYHA